MDWNWFFSSIAQSVAALVGVLGAFLIARLLNSQAEFQANGARTRELVRRSMNLRDLIQNRNFEWYNAGMSRDAIHDIVADLKNGRSVPSPESCFDVYNFSLYALKTKTVAAIRTALEAERERLGRRRDPAPMFAMPDVDLYVPSVAIAREGETISEIVVAIKSHVRETQEHLALIRTNPERSSVVRVVLVSLLLLFWTGVFYPLTRLPVGLSGESIALFSNDSAGLALQRGIILIVASLVFTGMIGVLGFMHERLSHPESEIAELDQWIAPGAYSDYLQTRVDNGFPLW